MDDDIVGIMKMEHCIQELVFVLASSLRELPFNYYTIAIHFLKRSVLCNGRREEIKGSGSIHP